MFQVKKIFDAYTQKIFYEETPLQNWFDCHTENKR